MKNNKFNKCLMKPRVLKLINLNNNRIRKMRLKVLLVIQWDLNLFLKVLVIYQLIVWK